MDCCLAIKEWVDDHKNSSPDLERVSSVDLSVDNHCLYSTESTILLSINTGVLASQKFQSISCRAENNNLDVVDYILF